ncbi:MAG TPA: GNAT family N-acetyltransferase [Cyclobacteriaceae bacterium]|nr:GNAT family N-acetyltransferase [Cyclobacteriaceae bacterium]
MITCRPSIEPDYFTISLLMIRDGRIDDALDIRILLAQLGYSKLSEDDIRNKIIHYSSKEYKIFVVEVDGHVIGFISLHCYEAFHSTGKIGRITALCIHDKFQSKGYGKQLLVEAEKYFVQSGCLKLEVTSNKRRTQAHNFYLSQGYLEDSRKFVKPLFTDLTSSV